MRFLFSFFLSGLCKIILNTFQRARQIDECIQNEYVKNLSELAV